MGNYDYKQTIVVRGDINMGTKGKLIAQCCHASMGALLKFKQRECTTFQLDGKGGAIPSTVRYKFDFPVPVDQWLEGSFAKIVLKAPGLQDLLDLEVKAKELGIPYCLIEDDGTTVFGEKTITCIAIGPWDSYIIEPLTKDFKLL